MGKPGVTSGIFYCWESENVKRTWIHNSISDHFHWASLQISSRFRKKHHIWYFCSPATQSYAVDDARPALIHWRNHNSNCRWRLYISAVTWKLNLYFPFSPPYIWVFLSFMAWMCVFLPQNILKIFNSFSPSLPPPPTHPPCKPKPFQLWQLHWQLGVKKRRSWRGGRRIAFY